jgi:hypothetical protein
VRHVRHHVLLELMLALPIRDRAARLPLPIEASLETDSPTGNIECNSDVAAGRQQARQRQARKEKSWGRKVA